MGQGKKWSELEINYLNEHWGKNTLSYLSIHFKRTKVAIHIKAKRMNLGAITRADEYLTANQVAVLLRVDSHTVLRWVEKYNLKAIKKIMLFKKRLCMIKHCDLYKWLKNNQNRFDSRKIELFGLGYESLWLKVKRKRDSKLPKNRFKKWTKFEIQKIINLSRNMNYSEIAKKMDRSHSSIEKQFGRLRDKTKLNQLKKDKPKCNYKRQIENIRNYIKENDFTKEEIISALCAKD